MESELGAIIQKNKLRGGFLSIVDKPETKAEAGDRVIVDHFFGRQGMLWAVVSSK